MRSLCRFMGNLSIADKKNQDSVKKKRYYYCDDCDHNWENYRKPYVQRCNKCGLWIDGYWYKDNAKDKRKFGYYYCDYCNREWQSAHSWNNYGQECSKCGTIIYAYKRKDLHNPSQQFTDVTKPHQTSLCEKCAILGRNCVQTNDTDSEDEFYYDDTEGENSEDYYEEGSDYDEGSDYQENDDYDEGSDYQENDDYENWYNNEHRRRSHNYFTFY